MKFFWKICIALTVLIAILILLGGGVGVFIVITNTEDEEVYLPERMKWSVDEQTWTTHFCKTVAKEENNKCKKIERNELLNCIEKSKQSGELKNCTNPNVNRTLFKCDHLEYNVSLKCDPLIDRAYRICTKGFDEKTKHCVVVNKFLKSKLSNCDKNKYDSITKCTNDKNVSFKAYLFNNPGVSYTKLEMKIIAKCVKFADKFHEKCMKENHRKTEELMRHGYCEYYRNQTINECEQYRNDSISEFMDLMIEETRKCSNKTACDQTILDTQLKRNYIVVSVQAMKTKNKCIEEVNDNTITCIRYAHGMLVEDKQCYYDIHNFTSKWCGDDLKHYDQHEKLNTSNPSTDDLCLDMVTPLAIQPICNTTKTIAGCERDGGQCYEGRCCPKLKKRDQDQFALYNLPFKTNVSCDPYSPLPLIFSFAFCNTNDRKVWTIGHKDRAGASVRTNLRFCSDNTECEKEFVCVNLIQGKRMCYFDPAYEVGLDYIAAVGYFFPIFFVLVALITCFVLAAYKL